MVGAVCGQEQRNEIRNVGTGNRTDMTIWRTLGNPGAAASSPLRMQHPAASPDADWEPQLGTRIPRAVCVRAEWRPSELLPSWHCQPPCL